MLTNCDHITKEKPVPNWKSEMLQKNIYMKILLLCKDINNMEQFSAEFWMTLANLIYLWKEEKGAYDKLHITPMTVLLEVPDQMTSVELEAMENPLTTDVILQ